MARFKWNGGSGSLGDSGNWTDEGTGTTPAGPPGTTDIADFVTAGGTLSGSGVAGTAYFTGGGPWTLIGTLTIPGLPNPPFVQGGFVVSGAGLTVNGGVLNSYGGTGLVGYSNTGVVVVENGGSVTSLGSEFGGTTSGNGTLLLTGAGSSWHDVANPAYNNGTYTTGYSSFGTGSGGTGRGTITNGALYETDDFASIGFRSGAAGSVTVSAGGTWTIGTGMSVGLGGSGTLTVDAGTVSTPATIDVGQSAGAAGTISIGSGGVISSRDLYLGDGGTGSLTMSSGSITNTRFTSIGLGGQGTATLTGGTWSTTSVNIGRNAGSNGQFSISNAAFTVTGGDAVNSGFLIVGQLPGASGSVFVGPGGVLRNAQATQAGPSFSYLTDIGLNGTGTVTVSGAGAMLDAGTNGLTLGNSNNGTPNASASGTLSISSGGLVLTGTPNDASLAALFAGRIGSGLLTIDGAGSELNSTGSAVIGRGGNATLVVQNHGTLLGGDSVAGIYLGDGATTAGGAWLYGGTGSGTITSGGYLESRLDVLVGAGGSRGTLTISNTGSVMADRRVSIGVSSTYAGTVAYNGGLAFQNGSSTVVAPNTVFGGNGSVHVSGGGVLQAHGTAASGIANIIVGSGAGSTGTLTATDSGTLIDSGPNHVTVGSSGTGFATITNHASLVARTSDDADPALVVGSSATAMGTLEIGTGGIVTASGEAMVGRAGTGHLLVESGGTLQSGNNASFTEQGFRVGISAGASGNVTVTGVGSEIVNIGRFDIGVGASGSLLIQNGGTVVTGFVADPASPAAEIGENAGSGGSSVTVTGAGSLWQVGGALLVGDAASGTLTVSFGGTVSATDLDLGVQAGGHGELKASVGNAAVVLSGTATIGDAGSGHLLLGPFAKLTASSIVIGTQGTIDISNAVLDPLAIANDGLIEGYGTAAADIVNDETIYAIAGTLEVTGSVTGTGEIDIASSGDFQADDGIGSGQNVVFTGAGGELDLRQPGLFDGAVKGFGNGDLIHAQGATHFTFDQATQLMTLLDASNAEVGTIAFLGGGYTASSFAMDTSGDIRCFLAGTRIATPSGEVAVERLAIGDAVLTLSGEARRIAWIGEREVDLARHPRRERVAPVRVRRGAFGPHLPKRDLLLSPDHALYVDGVLIPVKLLANGRTIVQEARMARAHYLHVELAQHDVLLAEGLPAESLLPGADRSGFANNGGPVALHPDFHPLAWEAEGCAPLVLTGPVLDRIRARLGERAVRRRTARAA